MTKDTFKNKELVSIIMPAFNAEEYINEAIESVLKQTYENWELIIVNDCSTDKTLSIVKRYAMLDRRILYFTLEKNSGAASARNKAIELAQGRYLAFLDSDDLWEKNKLAIQIKFMKENNYYFTATSYHKIDENSESLNRVVDAYERLDYFGLLKECPGNSTVIYDVKEIGKVKIPNIRKRNDYVMWLQVIKKSKYLYGINLPLSSHRIRKGSLSKNKFSLVKYHWKIYREIEEINSYLSLKLILYWISKSVLKK